MILVLIIGFVLGAAAVIFILQNTAIVALSFLQWHFETSIALVVILAILVGLILALLMTLPGAIGNSFRMRRLNKHNQQLAQEAAAQKQMADEAQARLVATQTTSGDNL